MDIEAESMGYSVKTGPKIGSKVAQFLNNDIVNQDDMTKIQKLREEYCRPANVPNLTVPKMNSEINPSDTVLVKELNLVNIQQDINSALFILADVLNDQSKVKHTYSRHDIYSKTNQAASLLMHTHKNVSFARKLNVKHMLKDSIQHLCTKKHIKEDKRRSNTELFEEDLSLELDKCYKQRKVTTKVTKSFTSGQFSKNFRNGAQRTPFRFGNQNYARGKAPRRDVLNNRGRVQNRGRGQKRPSANQ